MSTFSPQLPSFLLFHQNFACKVKEMYNLNYSQLFMIHPYSVWKELDLGSGSGTGRKGSRSFSPILRAVQIQIKILKKDLDPGFSDPFVRSSNSLEAFSLMQ